jgi:hypothetical protein
LKIDDYQKAHGERWNGYPLEDVLADSVKNYTALRSLSIINSGLCGEAGEASEHIKKWMRDLRINRTAAAIELGDTLAYLDVARQGARLHARGHRAAELREAAEHAAEADGRFAGKTGDHMSNVPNFLLANNDAAGAGKPSNPKDQAAETRIPLWLCSATAMVHWSLAQFAGLLKYGAWNWRIAGVRTSVYISALKRHIKAYEEGETYDPVDGTRHLGNIMACASILLDAEAEGKLIDDRPPSSKGYRAAVAEGEATMAALREQYKDRTPRHWTIADSRIDAEFE